MPSAPTAPSTAKHRWIAIVVGLVTVAIAVYGAWVALGFSARAAASVVDDFVATLESNPAAAQKMMGPAAVFDLEPVTTAEADRRSADFFLRQPGLKVLKVLPGEPDGSGGQKATPRRFTLVTRGNATAPKQRMMTRSGKAGDPADMTLYNPEIVVEVRDGRIVVLRSELPR